MQTDELLAGRELDMLIAEKVMGQTVREEHHKDFPQTVVCRWISETEMLPGYSTDISAAWEIIEHLRPWRFNLERMNRTAGSEWRADFDNRPSIFSGYGDTAPLAICRAALAALA